MCGLLGVLGEPINSRFNIELIKHRGPDSEGIWTSIDGEFPVTLGHTRLSIIDLNDRSNQPMHSHCGKYVLVYNGEIYNYLELRKELINEGHTFLTASDTEVLLIGLIHYGVQFMLKCNGMWAFCLWDKEKKIALLARDRFGEKPLYFTEIPGGNLAFASEMKALYPYLPRVTPSVTAESMIMGVNNYEHTKECIIKGISRLPTGHYLRWSKDNILIQRWWNTLDHLVDPPDRYEDQVETWRDLFLDSVKIRMQSDVKMATALSGGIDSTAIASVIRYHSRELHNRDENSKNLQYAYCSVLEGSQFNELKEAKHVAQKLNLDLISINESGNFKKIDILQELYHVEDPYLTLSTPMMNLYRKMSEDGIKVSIDGHGADELFCGYGITIKDAYIDTTEKAEIIDIDGIYRSLSTGEYEPFIQKGDLWAISQIIKLHGLKMIHNIKDLVKMRRPISHPDFRHPAYKKMSHLNQTLYRLFHITTLPTLLRNYDRYSMASGVEVRMPFLDHRLVSYTFSLPNSSKLGKGFTKRILRDALDGIMVEPTRLRRDKIGWNAPIEIWIDRIGSELVSTNNKSRTEQKMKKILKRYSKIKKPSYLQIHRIWRKILYQLWIESLSIRTNT